jgi:hypothetical protein
VTGEEREGRRRVMEVVVTGRDGVVMEKENLRHKM